jgi:hypothetical protein
LVIRLTIERLCPLSGTAALGSGEAVRFEGWFGLLAALAELVESDEHGARDVPPG